MSIYGSFGDIDDESPQGAPLVYQGSHVFPDPSRHVRGGSVDLGCIARFVSPDGRDDTEGDDGVWPLLRMSVRGEAWFRDDYGDTVVLTGEQVHALRDHLNVWLARAGVESGDWMVLEQARRARWSA